MSVLQSFLINDTSVWYIWCLARMRYFVDMHFPILRFVYVTHHRLSIQMKNGGSIETSLWVWFGQNSWICPTTMCNLPNLLTVVAIVSHKNHQTCMSLLTLLLIFMGCNHVDISWYLLLWPCYCWNYRGCCWICCLLGQDLCNRGCWCEQHRVLQCNWCFGEGEILMSSLCKQCWGYCNPTLLWWYHVTLCL